MIKAAANNGLSGGTNMGREDDTEPVSIEYHDDVALVRLNRGITNAINLELVQKLRETLRKVQQTSKSLVLCSSNDKFFSIGWNIPELYYLGREDFAEFYRAFAGLQMDLFILPIPTIAAVTGHAVAGGCILALCCDYRYIADGKKFMGLNEVKLGVPIPYPVDCILRSIVGTRVARTITDFGEFYLPEQLLEMGIVDCVRKLEEVLPLSVEKAKVLGALPEKALAAIKRDRTEPVERQILQHLEEKERIFLECWFSREARIRLEEQMKKF
jgi:enoyl-CoA hydratase/carnithine racemase